jgi:prefoldin subunit 5
MAKKPKETSTPLVFALVFFILTTVAFGVMWYLAYSDQQTYIDAKAKAEKDAANLRNTSRESELLARTYRVYLAGTDLDNEDKTTIDNEAKPGDKLSTELKRLNGATAKALNFASDEALFKAVEKDESLKDYGFWKVDAITGKVEGAPAKGILKVIGNLRETYDKAEKSANADRATYANQIEDMKKAAKALDDVTKKFKDVTDKLPVEFQQKLEAVTKGFDKRTKDYQDAEKRSNDKIAAITEERDRADGKVRKLEERIAQLESTNSALQQRLTKAEGGKDTFVFDEPQGKILRKLPEGVVEINLGSTAGVRPGLTFTVLPMDFPEKGRSSRMRSVRVPDGRGGYKSIDQFIPKGSIEVYEVVGPTLSLARIQPGTELDPIRDGIAVGDLLYNSVWRKGVADHIALIGIFDINGDGTDDIASVVRDLTKMGIPVDAYFDMKKRAWVGQVTERTRYIVEGYRPLTTANDPLLDEKTKLLGAIDKSVTDAKQKGVESVNFRDFFSRMGYKFRLDVTDDKVNQATGPYLTNVGVGGGPVAPQP